MPADTLAGHVEAWVDTPATGGTAIAADGVIHLSDVNCRRILTITPDRQVDTVIADPRLIWLDAMWIDGGGYLWIPATQLNRALAGERQAVDYPVWIYKMRIGVPPAAIDHPDPTEPEVTTVGELMLSRLHDLGVRHIFGLPGDYTMGLLDQVEAFPSLDWGGRCNELSVAYTAGAPANSMSS